MEPVIGRAGVEDRGDSRMRELGQSPAFTIEVLGELRVLESGALLIEVGDVRY